MLFVSSAIFSTLVWPLGQSNDINGRYKEHDTDIYVYVEHLYVDEKFDCMHKTHTFTGIACKNIQAHIYISN